MTVLYIAMPFNKRVISTRGVAVGAKKPPRLIQLITAQFPGQTLPLNLVLILHNAFRTFSSPIVVDWEKDDPLVGILKISGMKFLF